MQPLLFMVSAKYKKYLQSKEWANLKLDLLRERGCFCENCGKPKPPNVLHIHHKTYERIFNELATDLVILCPLCHKKEHGIGEKKKPLKPVKKAVKPKAKKKPKNKFELKGKDKRIQKMYDRTRHLL